MPGFEPGTLHLHVLAVRYCPPSHIPDPPFMKLHVNSVSYGNPGVCANAVINAVSVMDISRDDRDWWITTWKRVHQPASHPRHHPDGSWAMNMAYKVLLGWADVRGKGRFCTSHFPLPKLRVGHHQQREGMQQHPLPSLAGLFTPYSCFWWLSIPSLEAAASTPMPHDWRVGFFHPLLFKCKACVRSHPPFKPSKCKAVTCLWDFCKEGRALGGF